MTSRAHPYLSGHFAPVCDEVTIVGFDVHGTLPAALDGTFLRHGPNPIGTPPSGYDPAAGDGMVHAVTLRAGRALAYKNRWVRTTAAATKLGDEPPAGPPQPEHDCSNHTIVGFAGRVFSLSGGALPYELTCNLDTAGRTDLDGGLPRGMTAHPKVDPVTGGLVALSTSREAPFLSMHRLAADGGSPESTALPLSRPLVVHDFALSGRHVIVFDETRLTVIDRHDASARWIGADACAVDHVVNAYDTPRSVVVDLTVGGGLERWTIRPRAGGVDRVVLDATPQTSSRINDAMAMAPYRYAYTVVLDGDGRAPGRQLFKHDLVTSRREAHDFGPDAHAGEFVFVADPNRRHIEDGGWLIGFTHHDSSGDACLMVVDAQDVAGPPVAAVRIPRRIPFGSHSAWIPS